jgi:hypothetical protein
VSLVRFQPGAPLYSPAKGPFLLSGVALLRGRLRARQPRGLSAWSSSCAGSATVTADVAHELTDVPGFSQADGFDRVTSASPADLYLVDPAYSEHRDLDWRRALEAGRELSERGAAGLIWYPLYSKERALRQLGEAVIAEIRWPHGGAYQAMKGCGLVALGAAADIVRDMGRSLTLVADVLSGSVRLWETTRG